MSIWSAIFRANREASAATAVRTSGEEWLARADEHPQDPIARQHAGNELALREDRAGAIRHWLAAADIYMSQGFAVKAMAVLVSVIQLDSENDEVRSRIANIARDEDMALNRGADLTIRTRLRAWAPLFSDFSRADLSAVIAQMHVSRFKPGDVLLHQGEIAQSLSVLMEGSVRIVLRNSHGENVEIGRLRHGDFFGESSILLDLQTPATLIAETNGELLVWPREAFEAICAERPALRDILERFRQDRAHQAVEVLVARAQTSA